MLTSYKTNLQSSLQNGPLAILSYKTARQYMLTCISLQIGPSQWLDKSTSEGKFAFFSDFYKIEKLALIPWVLGGCGVSIAAFWPVGPSSIPLKTLYIFQFPFFTS